MTTNNSINTQNPVQVAKGGLGVNSIPAYANICGGTSSTSAVQTVGPGATGTAYVSGGAGALPKYQPGIFNGTAVTGSGVVYNSSGVWSAQNPQTSTWWFDDMIYDNQTGADQDVWPWFWSVSGGSGAIVISESGHPGIGEVATLASTTGQGALIRSDVISTTDTLHFEALVRFPTLSTAGDEYTSYIGIVDSAGGSAPTNGIYFQYKRTVSTNWACINTASSSSSTATGATVAVVAGTWYHLVFDANGTQSTFSINGTTFTALSTNFPSSGLYYCFNIIKSAGTNSRKLDIDMAQFYAEFSASRYT